MGELNITKEDLLERYHKRINAILDVCDWKTGFDPDEICDIICGIIYDTDGNIYNPRTVCSLYLNKIDSLNLNRGEWFQKYGIKEIVYMIYDIIDDIPM